MKFDLKTTVFLYEISTVELPEGYSESELGSYETMIQTYKDEWMDYQKRYNTMEEAIAGHLEAIEYVTILHKDQDKLHKEALKP